MKKIIILTLISTFTFCLSCNDDALDKANPNDLPPESFYLTGPQLEAGVNAVYSSLQSNNLFAREYFFVHDMRSDETQIGGQLEAARQQVLQGTHSSSNPLTTEVWTGWYRVIHQANLVLANADKPKDNITEALRTRVVGEAKFLRALAYFDLVVLYGGVPLMTEPVAEVADDKPRASEDEVYALIIKDLQEAIAALPDKSGYAADQVGRAHKQAAQTLLGRAYMQRGEYALARTQFLEVINSGEFDDWKTVKYGDNFTEENEFNAESIFEVVFSTSFANFGWDATGQGQGMETTVRGQEYAPQPAGWRNLIPSDNLLAAFEPNDPRYDTTFYSPGDKFANGTKVISVSEFGIKDKPVSWRKYTRMYKADVENQKSGINFRVMRFAEVLLNLAECENALGNDPAAIDYIDEVRSRVGMPGVVITTNVFDAIMHERQVEFAGEQIRNRDLLRWRKLGKATINPIPNFKPLLPIPQSELSNNSELTQADQNAGY
jgi:starch-binding outer membrane protein, SusD/RagB family